MHDNDICIQQDSSIDVFNENEHEQRIATGPLDLFQSNFWKTLCIVLEDIGNLRDTGSYDISFK